MKASLGSTVTVGGPLFWMAATLSTPEAKEVGKRGVGLYLKKKSWKLFLLVLDLAFL